tara:strand:+ start:736 stop:1062 length:327 start_codon:yes stop_codon:yes gene_type:complete
MESNYVIVIAIIATSLATFISRFMGAITSRRVSVNSKIFQWFNCVAYATLAALLGRMIVFPAGVLANSELLIRIIVMVSCVLIFIILRKNLVIPTIFSAILLSVLTSI